MNDKNNNISAFQFAVLGAFLGLGLTEGIADVFLFSTSRQNSWFTAIITVILSLIPFLLLLFIINYEPNKNIIEKINTLFGKQIGGIINFILVVCIFFILILTTWAIVEFGSIKYLTETPPLFIGSIFLIAVTYAVIKGLEAIARGTEILFYIIVFFNIFIGLSLSRFIEIENLKPILEQGITPLIKDAIRLLAYTAIPFIVITIIPKNSVTNNRHLTKYFLGGFLFSMFTLVYLAFMVISTIGADLANLYRFPSYYVLKKINIGGLIENVENFLASHWLFDMYVVITLSFYYITQYINSIFKIKREQDKKIAIFIIAFMVLIISNNIFPSSSAGVDFLKHQYATIIAFTIFIIMVLFWITVNIKKHHKIKGK